MAILFKCYYTYDKKYGKVLIPGRCGNTLYTNDIKQCTCEDYPETFKEFEKTSYNEKISEARKYIKELESELSAYRKYFIKNKIDMPQ